MIIKMKNRTKKTKVRATKKRIVAILVFTIQIGATYVESYVVNVYL